MMGRSGERAVDEASANNDAVDPALLEESMEDLYDRAPCGYLSARIDGRIVKVNRTLLSWLGHEEAEEIVGARRFQDLLTVPGKIFYETHYLPLLLLQDSVGEIAFDLVRRDGRPLHVLLASTLVRDEDSQVRLNRTTIFNATQRRAYERELLIARRQAERAARAKACYLAMLGHDVREPVIAIQLAASQLERSGAAPERSEPLGTIKSEAARLLDIVDDILLFGRLDAGTVTLQERSFDVRQLVDEVVGEARIAAEKKGLALSVHVDERAPPRVIGDPAQLGRVLTHLLRNATAFTHHGSVILAVELAGLLPDAALLDVRVSDTGVGIHRQRLREILEDFANAPPAIPAGERGCGIGLAICRKILELLGAEMQIESTPGKGSTFSFRVSLPLT